MFNWFKKREKRASGVFNSLNPKDPALAEIFLGTPQSASGQVVTAETALRITAVWSAVTLISSEIGMLPCELKRRQDSGSTPAVNDSRYNLLFYQSNRFQTSQEWRETMLLNRLLRGRAVSEIITDARGQITDLIPLHPDTVTPFLTPEKTIAYAVLDQSGRQRVLLAEEVVDLRGPSRDFGLTCLSPIKYGSDAIGAAQAANLYSGGFFDRGSVASGVLEVPQPLSDKAHERLVRWKERFKGVRNAHDMPILEEGMKWHATSINPEDAQLLETRQFSIGDIARLFHIPPHKIGDLTKSTFSNIEQQNLDWVIDGLLPEVTRLEGALTRALLTREELSALKIDINLRAILRGDSAARSSYYRALWQIGVLSPNDIRKEEGLNTIEGGDERFIPANMTPLSQPVGSPTPLGSDITDQPAKT